MGWPAASLTTVRRWYCFTLCWCCLQGRRSCCWLLQRQWTVLSTLENELEQPVLESSGGPIQTKEVRKMEVILLEKTRNLGSLGDKVKVRSGYGRNFLIPQGKAVPATESNIKHFEERRAELEKQANEKLAGGQARAARLTEIASVTVPAKAGDEGKLFGSVGTRDIAEAITAAGLAVSKAE